MTTRGPLCYPRRHLPPRGTIPLARQEGPALRDPHSVRSRVIMAGHMSAGARGALRQPSAAAMPMVASAESGASTPSFKTMYSLVGHDILCTLLHSKLRGFVTQRLITSILARLLTVRFRITP